MTDVMLIEEKVLPGFRLGRHVEHDPRSRQFPANTAAGPLAAVLWPRKALPFNQGSLGSCTGNAVAGAAMTDPLFKQGRVLVEADAVKAYSRATHLDRVKGIYPPDDTGSSGLAACKAAVELGWFTAYKHAFGIAHALAALQLGPVITGVNWYEGFDRPDSAGHVSVSGQIRGGHEFEVVGYNPDRELVRACNSWGSDWGDHGYFTFSRADWARLLHERGDVTVPVSG